MADNSVKGVSCDVRELKARPPHRLGSGGVSRSTLARAPTGEVSERHRVMLAAEKTSGGVHGARSASP